MDVLNAYRKIKELKKKFLTTLKLMRLSITEKALVSTSSARRGSMEALRETDSAVSPIVLDKDARQGVRGYYFVGTGARYICQRGAMRVICLDLLTFKRWDRDIKQGEQISIEPWVAHAFLADSLNDGGGLIRKIPGNSWPYSYEIDLGAEYSGPPHDFKLDPLRMRLAEAKLRLKAIQYCDEDLNLAIQLSILELARDPSEELSGAERALLFGMGFDWLYRLSKGKCQCRLALGAYSRIDSSSGDGYHEVRATEIGPNGGPIIYSTHLSHFEGQKGTSLPRITIGRNVLIAPDTYLEVGLGLSIGEFSWIVQHAELLKHEHKADLGGQLARCVDTTTFFPTQIRDHAMIGHSAKLLPKVVYVGRGSLIGYGAIVARSVGDYAIVAGNPAKVIAYNLTCAQSLEKDSSSDAGISEGAIPYDLLLERVSGGGEAMLVGVPNREDVISAARLFKRVTAIDCCDGGVFDLVSRLSESQLYNVCIQSTKDSLIYELVQRKSLIIWLAKSHLPLSEEELLSAIEKGTRGLLIEEGASLLDILSLSPLPEYQLGNSSFYFFSTDAIKSRNIYKRM